MKFDDTAPVLSETHKTAPVNQALQNALIPIVLALNLAVAAAFGVGLLALAFRWPGRVVLAAVGAAVIVGVLVGLNRVESYLLATEESTQYREGPPAATAATPMTNWEMPLGPHQLRRGTLPAPPELILEWARAAIASQSLSYATWAEKFGGQRKYASFRQVLVTEGLAIEQGRELLLTRDGWALFAQAVALGDHGPALLEQSRLLRPPEA